MKRLVYVIILSVMVVQGSGHAGEPVQQAWLYLMIKLDPHADGETWLNQQDPDIGTFCDIRRILTTCDGTWFATSCESSVNLDDAIRKIKGRPGVLDAVPDAPIAAAWIPDDPYYLMGMQWSLGHASSSYWPSGTEMNDIGAEDAWDVTRGDSGVVIAVLDSGIDAGHPDFAGHLDPGYDFVNNDPFPDDDDGHGTLVAGIAASAGNNGIGCTGVAPDCRLMPVKVLDQNLHGLISYAVSGIEYATVMGAEVINCSFVTSTHSSPLWEAINAAVTQDIVIIAATGNNARDIVLLPAAYPEVLAVGATSMDGEWANFSNYGPETDIMAPGVSIFNAFYRNGFENGPYSGASGTSFSCAHASGVAALVRSQHLDWPESLIRSHIIHCGTPIVLPNNMGCRRLDAGTALNADPVPDLQMTDFSMFLIADHDGDGLFDPTDTAHFFIEITNMWGDAGGAEVWFEMTGLPLVDLSGPQIVGPIPFHTSVMVPFIVQATDLAVSGESYSPTLHVLTIPPVTDEALFPIPIEMGGWEISGGYLVGVLGLPGSPPATKYRVLDTPMVPETGMLMIEPGVTLEFLNASRLDVYGVLIAEGVWTQPIQFKPYFDAEPWQGIILFPSSHDCSFEYCVITGATTGLNVLGGSNMMSGTMSDCDVHLNDTGILVQDETCFQINHCNIYNNADQNAIFAYNTSPTGPVYQPYLTNTNVFSNSWTPAGIQIFGNYESNQVSPYIQGCNIWGASPGIGYDVVVSSYFSYLPIIMAPSNYWGPITTPQLPGNADLIYDYWDDPILSQVSVTGFLPTASETSPPYLVSAAHVPPSPLSMNDVVEILLRFNCDMEPGIPPVITCGDDYPYDEYAIPGTWIIEAQTRDWLGTIRIDERFADSAGPYFISVSGAYSAEVMGQRRECIPNTENYFTLASGIEGVHTMSVVGKINSVDVSWDDELKRNPRAAYSGHVVYWGTQSGNYTDYRLVPSPGTFTTLTAPDDILAGEIVFIGIRYYESDTSTPPPFVYLSEIEVEGCGSTLTVQVPAAGIGGLLILSAVMSWMMISGVRRYCRKTDTRG